MDMPFVLGGVIGGALIGVAADRLASRWPAHPDGSIRPVDWRTAAVVLAGAAAFGGLLARWDDPRDVLVLGIYIAALIVLLATDLDQMLLPDLITLPLIVVHRGPARGGPQSRARREGPRPRQRDHRARSSHRRCCAVTDKLFRGALGMGDLKLAVSLGLVAGLTNLFVGFLVATVVFAFVVILLRRHPAGQPAHRRSRSDPRSSRPASSRSS